MTEKTDIAAQMANVDFNRLSGLEFLRKQMDGEARLPFSELLGFELVSVEDGRVQISTRPTSQFYNPMMRIHGGFTASLIDTCMGSAVLSKLSPGTGVGTVVLNVNFVGKLTAETGQIIATGQVLHFGRSMITAEARVIDLAGKLYAHGTGTFLIYPK